MKKLIFILSIFTIIYSCTKKESTSSGFNKLTADDSMRLGLLKIGQQFQGGIIAYILVSGDPGYDANKYHGLIAANSDQSQSTGIRWHNGSLIITGATGTAIGTGLSNTIKIIGSQGPNKVNYAVGLANTHNGGGYTDWFLPSKDELNKLYVNKLAIGGFICCNYWSSTEGAINFAWVQDFGSGNQTSNYKNNPGYIRAIRAF